LGSSISSTNSNTCSGASNFQADFEVGCLAILGSVLVDLGDDFSSDHNFQLYHLGEIRS